MSRKFWIIALVFFINFLSFTILIPTLICHTTDFLGMENLELVAILSIPSRKNHFSPQLKLPSKKLVNKPIYF